MRPNLKAKSIFAIVYEMHSCRMRNKIKILSKEQNSGDEKRKNSSTFQTSGMYKQGRTGYGT